MENYLNIIHTDLLYEILYYLNTDDIYSIDNLITINYEEVFRVKYNYIYPYVKIVFNFEIYKSLSFLWNKLLVLCETLDYNQIIKWHKYNLKTPNESAQILALDDKYGNYKFIYSSLTLKDHPLMYNKINKFNDICLDGTNYKKLYDTIHYYSTKHLSFFKTGKLEHVINSTMIKQMEFDHYFDRAYFTLLIIDDPKFDKSDLNVLIEDLEYVTSSFDFMISKSKIFDEKLYSHLKLYLPK